MSDKFQNTYRIEPARLKSWDYGWEGIYFITICTKDKICFFGHIEKGEMILNELGKIVYNEWIKSFEMRKDMNIWMGEFVVMPNHFHAIVGIGENMYNSFGKMGCRAAMHCGSTTHFTVSTENDPSSENTPATHFTVSTENDPSSENTPATHFTVSTENDPSSENVLAFINLVQSISDFTNSEIPDPLLHHKNSRNQFGPQRKNLGSIIRGFKSSVTIKGKVLNPVFAWQSRYYDIIIKDEIAFKRISNYIKYNPVNWKGLRK